MSEHPEQPMLPPEEPYLWDGSGPVDPTVARVERELAVLRVGTERPRSGSRSRALPSAMAAAAVLLLSGALVWWLARPMPGPALPKEVVGAMWRVVIAEGVTIGDEQASKAGGTTRVIEVGEGARARVRTAAGSTVEIDAGSVVELVEGHVPALRLVSGGVSGHVAAEDEPIRVELGAGEVLAYRGEVSMRTNAKGQWRVEVAAGWVEVADRSGKAPERPVRLAAGDGMDLMAGQDMIPLAEGMSPDLAKACEGYLVAMTGKLDPKMKWARLADVLEAADAAGAGLLWNLCWRVDRDERTRIIARLDELVPAKLASTRDARADLEPSAMDELWRAIAANAEDARRKGK